MIHIVNVYTVFAVNTSCCREHEAFVLLCVRLLTTHLSLAQAGGITSSVLGMEARPLRHLLFRLIDMPTPLSVQEVSASQTDRDEILSRIHEFSRIL